MLNKTLYHATTKVNAETILTRNRLSPIDRHINPVYEGMRQEHIKKDPGSLGYGFYLFSNLNITSEFMEEKIRSEGSILSIEVEIRKENLIDLTDLSQLNGYNIFKKKIWGTPTYKQRKKAFSNVPGGQSALEGALIDHYINYELPGIYRKKVGRNLNVFCVKAFTATQLKHSRGSFVANGVEYCLKHNKVIVNIKQIDDGKN